MLKRSLVLEIKSHGMLRVLGPAAIGADRPASMKRPVLPGMQTPNMASEDDSYSTLNVSRDADMASISRAYRKCALECHPDKNASAAARERFHRITEAYHILCDPVARHALDALLLSRSLEEQRLRAMSEERRGMRENMIARERAARVEHEANARLRAETERLKRERSAEAAIRASNAMFSAPPERSAGLRRFAVRVENAPVGLEQSLDELGISPTTIARSPRTAQAPFAILLFDDEQSARAALQSLAAKVLSKMYLCDGLGNALASMDAAKAPLAEVEQRTFSRLRELHAARFPSMS